MRGTDRPHSRPLSSGLEASSASSAPPLPQAASVERWLTHGAASAEARGFRSSAVEAGLLQFSYEEVRRDGSAGHSPSRLIFSRSCQGASGLHPCSHRCNVDARPKASSGSPKRMQDAKTVDQKAHPAAWVDSVLTGRDDVLQSVGGGTGAVPPPLPKETRSSEWRRPQALPAILLATDLAHPGLATCESRTSIFPSPPSQSYRGRPATLVSCSGAPPVGETRASQPHSCPPDVVHELRGRPGPAPRGSRRSSYRYL